MTFNGVKKEGQGIGCIPGHRPVEYRARAKLHVFFRQEVNATKIQFSDYMSVKNYATLIEDFGKN